LNIHKFTQQHAQHSSGSGYGQIMGFCEDDNETLGSTKHGEFLNRTVTTSFPRVALLHGGKVTFYVQQ